MFSSTLLSTMIDKQELPVQFGMRAGMATFHWAWQRQFRGLRQPLKPTIIALGVYFDQPLKSADRLCRRQFGAWARRARDLVTSHLHPRRFQVGALYGPS